MKERSVVEVVVLSLVTFGIYQLYWMYITNNELRDQKQEVAPVKWFVIPILVMIGILMLGAIFIGLGAAIGSDAGQILNGIGFGLFIIDYILFFPVFFGIYGYWIYWLYKYCTALEKESHKKIEFVLTFLVGILVGGLIWVGITQHMINEHAVKSPKKVKA
ncbi:MAG: DUF4234 domain-containing protein [bacterium]|nr:DUF4234 domain-containing protein [bacterium]